MAASEAPSSRSDVQASRTKLNQLIEGKLLELGLRNLQEFADHFRIGRSTLYELLRGRSRSRGVWVRPRLDTVIALADALERPVHEIIYLIEPSARGAGASLQSTLLYRLDLEPAGWIEENDDVSRVKKDVQQEVWIEKDFAQGKELSAFLIYGDSMAAGRHPIYHGDVVIVNCQDKGHNNTPVVARLVNNLYVCKLLKEDRFRQRVRLASANPEHLNGTPTAVPPEDVVEIVGRVVRVIHDEVGK